MAERWLDIPAADQLDAVDAAGEALSTLPRRERELLEELRDLWEGRRGPTWREVETFIRENAGRVNAGCQEVRSRAAEEFVNHLGRCGWEVLPPREVRHIRELTAGKKPAKMRAKE